MYRTLDPGKVIDTAERLRARVEERFPGSSLSALAVELVTLTRATRERAEEMGRPLWGLRAGVALFVALMLGGVAVGLSRLDLAWTRTSVSDFLQGLDAGTNELMLVAAAVYGLFAFETRIKRGRALKALHELRSLAHIVDMHQLTKDPDRLLRSGADTASSPKRAMSTFELARYLDYCSEALSLIGKVAALYAQTFQDEAALAAVDEVEDLTTGLSRKVWQKLMILHADAKRA